MDHKIDHIMSIKEWEAREKRRLRRLHMLRNAGLFLLVSAILALVLIGVPATKSASGQTASPTRAVFLCPQLDYQAFQPVTRHELNNVTVQFRKCTPDTACAEFFDDGSVLLTVPPIKDFNDVCGLANLGHEVLHALGADHESVQR